MSEQLNSNHLPSQNNMLNSNDACLLVGPTSRSIVTGLTHSFDLLTNGFNSRNIPHLVIDTGAWGAAKEPGAFDLRRIATTLTILFSFWTKLWKAETVYLLLSTTLLGFLRTALMIWPSHLMGCRVILHLNGSGFTYFCENQPIWIQYFIRFTVAQTDTIIVLSESFSSQFAFAQEKGTSIQVVPNSVVDEPPPEEVVTKSLPQSGPLRLLYLSNLMEHKGYLELLSACRILHHEYAIPIQCNFCGDFIHTKLGRDLGSPAEAKERFLHLITAWELNDVVQYNGLVSGDAKRNYLNDSHIFLLPTTHPWEGQPLSIVEALAFGTPVISTNHRGIPDQVIHKYNGLLIDGNDPQKIAESVQAMWQEPLLYRALSENAQQYFLENFTQEHHLDRMVSIICGFENYRSSESITA